MFNFSKIGEKIAVIDKSLKYKCKNKVYINNGKDAPDEQFIKQFDSIAIDDADLYDSKPVGNYDVFWGDHTKADLGGYSLTITEKLEFNSADLSSVITTLSSSELLDTALNASDYSHRLRIDVSLDPDLYDPDQVEHIGNGEKVKDSYYSYVQLS